MKILGLRKKLKQRNNVIKQGNVTHVNTKDGTSLLLMAVPFIIFIFIFSYIPIFGWIYAFFNFKPGIKLFNSPFVGFEYFRIIFSDSDIIRVLRNTLAISFLGILTSPIPIVLAIMINEVRSSRLKKFIQTTTIFPNFVSWIIVYSIAFCLFSTEGLVNTILQKITISDITVNVLSNSEHVWGIQTLISLWKNLGWISIIYLAAITGIDSELYDSAKVDGAGRYRSIIHITVPGIMPTYAVMLLLSVSNMLQVGLDQFLVFNNSLVSQKIEVIDLYVYRIGLLTQDYSYATAVGIFKSVVSISLLFIANSISKYARGSSII